MRTGAPSATSQLAWLSAAISAVWLLAVGPAYLQFGWPGVEAATTSAAGCLIPGCAVLTASSLAGGTRTGVYAVLAGTVLRLGSSLLAIWVMHSLRGLAVDNYLVWIGLFYIVALATETVLVLPPASARGKHQAEGKLHPQ
jgi:hypothetical protein